MPAETWALLVYLGVGWPRPQKQIKGTVPRLFYMCNQTPPGDGRNRFIQMKKHLFLLMLSTVMILAGCSKNEGGEGEPFTPPAQEQLTQNAYADNENTGGGFSFTADAPWTATVDEVKPQAPASVQAKSVTRAAGNNGNNVVWLKLYNGDKEAYSGGAGTITLRIEIDQNYTGERREATITIRSGNNTFTVTVVQEGTKQDGSENEPPVKVTKITLDKTELSLEAGAKTTLTATVEPADATIKSVVWSSSNPAVADVNPVTGEITAIADGTTTVTATSSSNKEVSASCAVTVGGGEPVVPDPSSYALVSRIERKITYWSEVPASDRYEDDAIYTFEYDDKNRVVSYAVDILTTDGSEESDRLVSTIDYSAPDRLRIQDQWSDVGTQTYDVLLNDKGYIRQCKSHPYSHDDNSYDFYTYDIEYNDEDRISRVAYSDEWYTYVYKDGVLSGGRYSDMGEVGEMSGFEQYFNQIPNDKLNLDINMLFLPILLEDPGDGDVPGRLGRLALLRMAGRGMDRYVTMFPGWSEEDGPMAAISSYPEPNKTIHKSYEYFTYDAEEIQDPMEYILNENGTVASVTTRATMVKIKHEYDIVIGDEFFDPEFPDMGYKGEICNRKNTELDRGTNTITYTFTYR